MRIEPDTTQYMDCVMTESGPSLLTFKYILFNPADEAIYSLARCDQYMGAITGVGAMDRTPLETEREDTGTEAMPRAKLLRVLDMTNPALADRLLAFAAQEINTRLEANGAYALHWSNEDTPEVVNTLALGFSGPVTVQELRALAGQFSYLIDKSEDREPPKVDIDPQDFFEGDEQERGR